MSAAPGGGMCGELHSCGAATEPCECLLRGAARTLQLHAALCGAGTPAAAPGRGTLASFARPRGICKLCRVTPARPAAHCKAVQKFAQLPHIPRRPVNPHTAAPQTCNLDSQGRGLLHTDTRHTSLEPVSSKLSIDSQQCVLPVSSLSVPCSHVSPIKYENCFVLV